MIVVVAKNIIREDSVEKFRELTKELIEETQSEKGCLEYNLYQDKNDKKIFTFIEKWERDEDLKNHTETAHFKRIVPELKKLSESDGSLDIYNTASEYKTLSNIFKRKSIRKFLDKPVEKEKIENILKAAMQSPSAANTQSWEFIVVTDKKALKDISQMSPYAKPTENAPAAIIVCCNLEVIKDLSEWMAQDLGACTENILLQITDEGLGGVWLGFYPVDERVQKIKEYYKLPSNIVPFSVIPFGYTDTDTKVKPRYSQLKVHYNEY